MKHIYKHFFLVICLFLSSQGAVSQSNERSLPMWGLAVEGKNAQKIDWRTSPPEVEALPNSGPSNHGATALGIDNCGKIAFYVLHSGVDQPNQLHIYSDDGTRLTNDVQNSPLQALSSVIGNNEIQVVRVPNKNDEWFIVYSRYKTPCNPSGTGTSSAYCPATVVYARIKYNIDSKNLSFVENKREVVISADTYTHGKAVSSSVNGDNNRHYLYLVKRQQNVDQLSIHRFIIDANGIGFSASSSTINAQYWWFCISGSSIELSYDETKLAITNRNQWTTETNDSDYEDIIVFDLNEFTSSSPSPAVISVPNLMVESLGKSIKELYTTPTQYYYRCLRYLRNKLMDIEFSPSGRYLYVVGGGYPAKSGVTFNTYLLQIDLQSGTKPNYNVRMLVQKGVNVSVECRGDSFVAAGDNYHPISQIESAFGGKIYFTKENEHYLFVLPAPDSPIPHDLTPQEVNLATPQFPNIRVADDAFVYYMPEGIDGYDYLPNKEIVNSNFKLNKETLLNVENLVVSLLKYQSGNTYTIEWGDGSGDVVQNSEITHRYSNAGIYEIKMSARDIDGCTTVTTKSVTVNLCQIELNFSLDKQTVFPRQNLNLILSNFNESYIYEINWGDGAIESIYSSSINHRYLSASDIPYNLSVTVRDEIGCFKTLIKEVVVKRIVPLCESVIHTSPTGSFKLDRFSGQYVFQGDQNCSVDIPFGCIQGQTNAPQLKNVVSASATTFSDSWKYDYMSSAPTGNTLEKGEIGKWRPLATYAYNKGNVLVAKNYNSGTFQLSHFNWQYPEVTRKSGWMKVNEVTKYTPNGEAVEEKNSLDILSAAKFGYSGALPYLLAQNAAYNSVLFESFENLYASAFEDGVAIGANTQVSTVSHSGGKSLLLGNQFTSHVFTLTKQLQDKGLLVRAWVNGAEAISNLKLKLSTQSAVKDFSLIARSGVWSLVEARIEPGAFGVAVGGTFTVSLVKQGGGSLWIDDVRMQPTDAEVSCYVYDTKTLRVLTVFDDQHFGLFYQYNAEGKLVRKQIETARGIKTVQETQYNIPEKNKTDFISE